MFSENTDEAGFCCIREINSVAHISIAIFRNSVNSNNFFIVA